MLCLGCYDFRTTAQSDLTNKGPELNSAPPRARIDFEPCIWSSALELFDTKTTFVFNNS